MSSSDTKDSEETAIVFRLVNILAVMITVVIISLVGGCQVSRWIAAQRDITLARGLTDPVAQRLWALSKTLDGINTGSFQSNTTIKENLIRRVLLGQDPVAEATTGTMARAVIVGVP